MLTIISISIFSCKKDDKLVTQDNYLGQEVSGTTDLDKQLYSIFVQPYNIDVRYKWDQSNFELQYTLVPPSENKVLPYMKIVQKVWLDPYNAETGSQLFMKTYTPKQLILSGSGLLNSDGTSIIGLGEGGLDILLANINGTNLKDDNAVTDILHLVNHEFTHILNQKKAYTIDFTKISPAADYIAEWYNSQVDPLSLGFISGYARKDPNEDFAEMVSWMLAWGKDGYEDYINQSIDDPAYAIGIGKLRQKEAIVVDYFKKSYNIDFYSLQTRVHASIAAATSAQ